MPALDQLTLEKSTWLVEGCPCIRWGRLLRSINLLSMFASPSILFSRTGTGETL